MNIGVEVLKESVIRVQSQLNDWMDCVFVVSKDDEEKAREVLEKAWDSFWEDGDGWCYGNYLEDKGRRRLSRGIWKRADRKRWKTEITPAGTVRQRRDRVLRAGLGEVQERSRAVGDYTGWLQLLRADGWQDQIRHLQCRRNRV